MDCLYPILFYFKWEFGQDFHFGFYIQYRALTDLVVIDFVFDEFFPQIVHTNQLIMLVLFFCHKKEHILQLIISILNTAKKYILIQLIFTVRNILPNSIFFFYCFRFVTSLSRHVGTSKEQEEEKKLKI